MMHTPQPTGELLAPSVAGSGPDAARINDEVWRGKTLVGKYAVRALRPPEVMILVRYQDQLSGRVLELGCGAGRVSGYLLELGAELHGIDISPEMVGHCRSAYPRGTFDVLDARDLLLYDVGPFDAVVASFNVLDTPADPERRQALSAIRRLLRTDGLLVLSSHNLAHASFVLGPLARLRRLPARPFVRTLPRVPRQLRNRRRLARFERHERDYAILNDFAHDYSLLHYYVDRDAQERQLLEAGFETIECLDGGGRTVAHGDPAAGDPELHYVARATVEP